MRLLLDTHMLLWFVIEPSKVGPAVMAVAQDPSTERIVSAASVWELATKERIGKLPEAERVLLNLSLVMEELSAVALPVTHAHAHLAGSLTWDHKDPFDRMLAAQAMLDNALLASADKAFDQLKEVRRIW
jgi:PIN domain nuclease of toxin-antitoxin system